MKRLAAIGVAASLLFGITACGERPQVIQYKQGTYQGKPFTQPYQNAPYNGDKAAWERTVTQRAQAQNEYNRVK
jgi:hypothetical protein